MPRAGPASGPKESLVHSPWFLLCGCVETVFPSSEFKRSASPEGHVTEAVEREHLTVATSPTFEVHCPTRNQANTITGRRGEWA
jgi:hypothetical protein